MSNTIFYHQGYASTGGAAFESNGLYVNPQNIILARYREVLVGSDPEILLVNTQTLNLDNITQYITNSDEIDENSNGWLVGVNEYKRTVNGLQLVHRPPNSKYPGGLPLFVNPSQVAIATFAGGSIPNPYSDDLYRVTMTNKSVFWTDFAGIEIMDLWNNPLTITPIVP
jgi:hypothetical protein